VSWARNCAIIVRLLQATGLCSVPLPQISRPMYLVVVSQLEVILEELRSLPPRTLGMAADYIHRLKRIGDEQRERVLERTAGSLPSDTADEIEKEIEEGCENIDERGW
jgi:hypothetical protein